MRNPKTIAHVGGMAIDEVVLEDGDVSVALLSFGAITRDWRVPFQGQRRPVLLGYADAGRYVDDAVAMGIIAGRVANRTSAGRFRLGGKDYQLPLNDGVNHIHGGPGGLGKRNWAMEADSSSRAVRLSYHSPDGEEGYPGCVDFTIDVSLDNGRLTYDMRARPDRPTPVNLAQHNYYNLMGQGDIWTHEMVCPADRCTPLDAALIPTGEVDLVDGSRFDFRVRQSFGAADPQHLGSDINLVLPEGFDAEMAAAEVYAPSGLVLRVWTDQPAVQFYTSTTMPGIEGGHDGESYHAFSGFCLEPQHFPDALNNPHFPSIICTPDHPYHQKLVVEIGELHAA